MEHFRDFVLRLLERYGVKFIKYTLPSGSAFRRTLVEGSDLDTIAVLHEEWTAGRDVSDVVSVLLSAFGEESWEWMDDDTKRWMHEDGRFVQVRRQTHSLGVRLFSESGHVVYEVDVVPMVELESTPEMLKLGLIKGGLGTYQGEVYGELKDALDALEARLGPEVRIVIRALKRYKKQKDTHLRHLSGYKLESAVVQYYQQLEQGAEPAPFDGDYKKLYHRFCGAAMHTLVWAAMITSPQRPTGTGLEWHEVVTELRLFISDELGAILRPDKVEEMLRDL